MLFRSLLISLLFLYVGISFSQENKKIEDSQKKAEEAYLHLEQTAQANQVELKPLHINHPEENNGKLLYQEIFAELQKIQDSSMFSVFLKKSETSPNETLPEEKNIRIELQTRASLLKKIKKATQSAYTCFDLDYSEGFMMKIPHLRPLRICSDLLGCQALIQIKDKNYEVALETSLDRLRLSKALAQDQILISELLSIAIRSKSLNLLAQYLSNFSIDETREVQLGEELKNFDAKTTFFRVYSGEIFFALDVFEKHRKGELSKSKLFDLFGFEGTTRDFGLGSQAQKMAFLLTWNSYEDIAFYYTLNAEIIDCKNKSSQLLTQTLAQIGKKIETGGQKYPMTTMIWPALLRVLSSLQRYETESRCFFIYLLARQYYKKHGYFPKTLDELPQAESAYFSDPFTGEPLQYKKEANSLLIYGVGSNEIDNQGDLDKKNGAEALDCGFRFLLQ